MRPYDSALLIGIVLLLALLAWRLRVGFVAFRDRFRKHLASYPDIEWRRDTTSGMRCAVAGVPLEIDLLETYIFRLRRPAPEREVFDQVVDALRHRVPPVTPPPFPLVQDRMLPVIKREAALTLSRGYRQQHHAVRSPLTGDLVTAYVIEGQFQMTYITEGMLSAWGTGLAALHVLAVENLRGKTRHLLDELGGPQTEYIALDGYDAARALVADLIVPPHIRNPVLAIPHEHACLIAESADAAALAARALTMCNAAELPLTPQLFVPTRGGLRPVDGPGATREFSEGQSRDTT